MSRGRRGRRGGGRLGLLGLRPRIQYMLVLVRVLLSRFLWIYKKG